jgi:hypothetical protein
MNGRSIAETRATGQKMDHATSEMRLTPHAPGRKVLRKAAEWFANSLKMVVSDTIRFAWSAKIMEIKS